MESVIHKAIVLSLNGLWQPIGFKTVKQAVKDMCGGEKGTEPPALALDIGYNLDAEGNPDFENPSHMNPVGWAEWVKLPVRPFDLTISSVKFTCRAPTVLVAQNFKKMPIKKFRPTKEAIRIRDGDICQYTGEKIPKNQGNIDHVVPVAKGGRDTFENMVWCKKKLNSDKGDKLNHEVGYKLIRKPRAPQPMPVSATIGIARHFDWKHFLVKNWKSEPTLQA